MEAFLYRWTDHKTGKMYVGYHKGGTDDGYVCSSNLMMEEYNKRPQDFSREIVAEGDWKDMVFLEAKLLNAADAKKNPNYYNQHNGNGEFYCKGHTEESKRKMRESSIRKHLSNETLRKMSDAQRGKRVSEETKRKLSEINTGKKHSPETRERMSRAQIGKIFSIEAKRKISEASKSRTHSDETRRKMSESHKNRKHTKSWRRT